MTCLERSEWLECCKQGINAKRPNGSGITIGAKIGNNNDSARIASGYDPLQIFTRNKSPRQSNFGEPLRVGNMGERSSKVDCVMGLFARPGRKLCRSSPALSCPNRLGWSMGCKYGYGWRCGCVCCDRG